MTNFDVEYLKLLEKILRNGVEVENRTGVNTIKVSDHSFRFDLSKEFPMLMTKQFYYRLAVTEMLWIWQMGSNDVRDLHERNVHIWDEWMVDEDGIYRIYEPAGTCEYDPDKEVIVLDSLSASIKDPLAKMKPLEPKYDKNGKVMTARSLIPGKTIKAAKYYGPEFAYYIGTAYGYLVNRYGYTDELIWTIKNNPTDRRMVYSLWQNEFLRTAVLPSCVWSTEWNVFDGTLNLQVHQRSCDVPLGLPFNVTQYAVFLSMIAQVTNLKPGIISYSINEPHIYVNQIDGIKEQLRRGNTYESFSRMAPSKLEALKNDLEKKLSLIEDKGSDEYLKTDSDLRIIDIILNPVKPELWLDSSIDDFYKFDNSKELKHVKVKKYKHMGKISFPISQ